MNPQGFSQSLTEAWLRGLWSVVTNLWFVWVGLVVFLLLTAAIRVLKERRLARSGIREVDRMTGRQFEEYLKALLRSLGYRVKLTRPSGDYGADLVVEKDGIKTVVQAKRHRKKVGIRAIQEAVAAVGYYKADNAMVITNSFFTKSARQLAEKNGVQLWDRNTLVKMSLQVQKAREKLADIPEIRNDHTCAVCGKPVSEKVQRYCIQRPEVFGGRVYCYEHQKEVRKNNAENTKS